MRDKDRHLLLGFCRTHLWLPGTMAEATPKATCLALTRGLKPLTETRAPSVRTSRAKRSTSVRLDPKP